MTTRIVDYAASLEVGGIQRKTVPFLSQQCQQSTVSIDC
jgi:hypothetical protein